MDVNKWQSVGGWRDYDIDGNLVTCVLFLKVVLKDNYNSSGYYSTLPGNFVQLQFILGTTSGSPLSSTSANTLIKFYCDEGNILTKYCQKGGDNDPDISVKAFENVDTTFVYGVGKNTSQCAWITIRPYYAKYGKYSSDKPPADSESGTVALQSNNTGETIYCQYGYQGLYRVYSDGNIKSQAVSSGITYVAYPSGTQYSSTIALPKRVKITENAEGVYNPKEYYPNTTTVTYLNCTTTKDAEYTLKQYKSTQFVTSKMDSQHYNGAPVKITTHGVDGDDPMGTYYLDNGEWNTQVLKYTESTTVKSYDVSSGDVTITGITQDLYFITSSWLDGSWKTYPYLRDDFTIPTPESETGRGTFGSYYVKGASGFSSGLYAYGTKTRFSSVPQYYDGAWHNTTSYWSNHTDLELWTHVTYYTLYFYTYDGESPESGWRYLYEYTVTPDGQLPEVPYSLRPLKDGKVFKGFFTSSYGTGTQYYDGQMKRKLSSYGDPYSRSLYAHFTPSYWFCYKSSKGTDTQHTGWVTAKDVYIKVSNTEWKKIGKDTYNRRKIFVKTKVGTSPEDTGWSQVQE